MRPYTYNFNISNIRSYIILNILADAPFALPAVIAEKVSRSPHYNTMKLETQMYSYVKKQAKHLASTCSKRLIQNNYLVLTSLPSTCLEWPQQIVPIGLWSGQRV